MDYKKIFRKNEEIKTNNLSKIWDEYAKVNYTLFTTPVQKEIVNAFLGSLLPCPNGIVHEGACGIGYYLKDILEKTGAKKIIATDFSTEMLEKAKERVLKMPKKYQDKIEFQQKDLTKDWPDGMFDAQTFLFLNNYLPDEKWKRIIEMAYKTTKNGGYICSAILLKTFTIKWVEGTHKIEQALFTPLSSIPGALKLPKILRPFDKLIEEGKIVWPPEDEYLNYHRQVGFRNVEITNRMYWGQSILVRAKK